MSIFKEASEKNLLYDFGDQYYLGFEHKYTFDKSFLPFTLVWCGYESMFNNSIIEGTNLDYYYIIFTTEGSGIIKCEDTSVTVRSRSIAIFDAHKKHSLTVEKTYWKFQYVMVTGKGAASYMNLLSSACPVTKFENFEKMGDYFEIIIKNSTLTGHESDIILCDSICHILSEIIIQSNSPINSSEPLYYRTKINTVIKMLNELYKEDLDCKYLAEKAEISVDSLFKYFKIYTSMTPHQYCIKCRINRAKELLQMSNKSILEISHEVGFKHVQLLIKNFKKHTGMTPLQFKNKYAI